MPTPDAPQTTINLGNHRYALAAEPDAGGAEWTARIAEHVILAGAAVPRRRVIDARSHLHDLEAIAMQTKGHGATAELVLADLEARLRATVGEAIRSVPD